MDISLDTLNIFAIVIVSIGAACDLRTHKIPNKLTFPAALLGIILQTLYFASWSYPGDLQLRLLGGLLYAVLGWLSGAFIMTITKLAMRKFGHGDTKLLAAAGTVLGPGIILIAYLYYSLVFGFYSLIRMIMTLPWRELWLNQEISKAGGQPVAPDLSKFKAARKEIIPVAPFIALGTVLAILLKKPTLLFLGFN